MILMVSGGDELSVPEGNNITISSQDISRRVTIHGIDCTIRVFQWHRCAP